MASGSSGNAALLVTDKTRILVDAGLSMRELAKRLASIGQTLEQLDAILITHEHSDHVSGLPVLARNKKIKATIYMTRLTAPAIDWGETQPRLEPFQAGARLRIGDVDVQSFGHSARCRRSCRLCFRSSGRAYRRGDGLGLYPGVD
ncbi:MAG: MBL fold metallo-hydrolase [Ignavibacteriota bacterium]